MQTCEQMLADMFEPETRKLMIRFPGKNTSVSI